MPSTAPLSIPTAPLLAWLSNNPDEAADLVRAVNLLLGLQVKLVRAGVVSLNQQESLMIGGESILMSLPLLWANGVPSDVAAGAVLADVIAKVNLILAGERSVQQTPGTPV